MEIQSVWEAFIQHTICIIQSLEASQTDEYITITDFRFGHPGSTKTIWIPFAVVRVRCSSGVGAITWYFAVVVLGRKPIYEVTREGAARKSEGITLNLSMVRTHTAKTQSQKPMKRYEKDLVLNDIKS